MSEKKILKNFKENGYIIIRNFLSKKEISSIFSQLEDLIDISLSSIKFEPKSFKTLDEKYLTLLKSNKTLKSHYYDFTKLLDRIVSTASSNKFL